MICIFFLSFASFLRMARCSADPNSGLYVCIFFLSFSAFLRMARCSADPKSGLYAPPVSENDVFYPMDDEPMGFPEIPRDEPMGFPEIPPLTKRKWRADKVAAAVSPLAFATTQSFKKKYVTREGGITSSDPGENSIEVAATPLVSEAGHRKGAVIVARMLANINDDVWNNLVRRGVSVGIFSRHESLTVFPEYRHLADTLGCRGTCAGSCRRTCTDDGRKWDDVVGAARVRAAVLESNILCDEYDPFRKTNNILVHEFVHSIHVYGLPPDKDSELDSAFRDAKRNRIWDLESYAMSTVREYFAEAGGVWFGVNRNRSSGGMDSCSAEMSCRSRLKRLDPKLYAVLYYTFNSTDKVELAPGNLKICV